jgi:hypothetical protein
MADVAEERRVLYVEVRGEENDGLQLEVGPDGLLVGRAGTCDVIFQSREVSRRHAYFYSDGRHCHVEDLGSKNGVLVNGRRVIKTSLKDGDMVDVGPSRFLIHSDDSDSGVLAGPAVGAGSLGREASAAPTQVMQLRNPLAVASLVFAALAYLHWGFGVGAIVLALLSLRETRLEVATGGRGLAWGGLALGLVGGLLSGWFSEGAPRLHEAQAAAAHRQCGQNLRDISAALERYQADHGGLYPASLARLVQDGLLKRSQTVCPTGKGTREYAYRPPPPGARQNAGQVIVWDSRPDNHPNGGWVLRRDGRVQWLGKGSFEWTVSQSQERAAALPVRSGPEP